MATESTPMLFAPPAPPFTLNEDQSVVVGRSRDCDLPIGAPEASRRHCEIRTKDGQFVVSDLGSTNGTYINGKPVSDDQPLRPGDRIEIGTFAITFCQVRTSTNSGEPTDGATTMLFDRDTLTSPVPGSQPPEAFQGDLAEVPPFAILQVLEMGNKTGALRISAADFKGSIWLENGAPVHAATAKHAGFEAASQMVVLETGRFAFEANEASPEKTIQASVTELLLEASRLADEATNDT